MISPPASSLSSMSHLAAGRPGRTRLFDDAAQPQPGVARAFRNRSKNLADGEILVIDQRRQRMGERIEIHEVWRPLRRPNLRWPASKVTLPCPGPTTTSRGISASCARCAIKPAMRFVAPAVRPSRKEKTRRAPAPFERRHPSLDLAIEPSGSALADWSGSNINSDLASGLGRAPELARVAQPPALAASGPRPRAQGGEAKESLSSLDTPAPATGVDGVSSIELGASNGSAIM